MPATALITAAELAELGVVPGAIVTVRLVRGVLKTGTVLETSDYGILLAGQYPAARGRVNTRCSIPAAGIADVVVA